jgi:CRISPR-associated endoribonuclease Cas6
MQIGKQSFLLEEVISHSDDPTGWTSFTTCETLVEQAKNQRLLPSQPLEMEFASLTTFNWLYQANKQHGSHYARLPLPSYIFGGLASRWQEIAPPALRYVVQRERIAAYIKSEGMIINDYQLQTHSAHFVQHTQPGFIGTCHYLLRSPDDTPTTEEQFTLRQQISRETGIEHSAEIEILTVRQQILLLSQLAFYTGVGYKTTMGMGQTRASY